MATKIKKRLKGWRPSTGIQNARMADQLVRIYNTERMWIQMNQINSTCDLLRCAPETGCPCVCSKGLCCNFGGGGWQPEKTVKDATRSVIFKWRQTAPELILCAVRWYLRYSLSLRDVEELFAERGLEADHTTIWRWVQRYEPPGERLRDTRRCTDPEGAGAGGQRR